jgi:hypothetical protein
VSQTSSENQYVQHFDKSQATHAAILCVAVDYILNCSCNALEDVAEYIEWELTESVVHLLKLLPVSDTEDYLKRIVVGTILQIARKFCKCFLKYSLTSILDELLGLINNCSYFLPTDLMISMAYSLSYMYSIRINDISQSLRIRIEDSSIHIIEILSTIAIVSISKEATRHGLEGLTNLAKVPHIGNKMMQFRCSILAVVTYILSEDQDFQQAAVSLCHVIFQQYLPISTSDRNASMVRVNTTLLQKALVDSILKIHEPSIQKLIVGTLNELLMKLRLNAKEKFEIIDALHHVAENSNDEDLVIEAGISFLVGAGKVVFDADILSMISTFLSSKFANVRSYALWLVRDICNLSDTAASSVANHSMALSKLAILIGNKTDEQDCLDAIQICRQLVLNEMNYYGVCKEHILLESLVQLAITEPIKNRKAHAISVEILIKLISRRECVQCFIPLAHVLPWLVMLANRTCDDELKAALVYAILNLTAALIYKSHEV